MSPNNASQYLTTLECETSISYDLNEDGEINSADLTSLVIFIMYGNQSINPLDINFDSEVDIFDILGFSDFLENTN